MPELPDVTVYVEALTARVLGQPLRQVALASPFVLRTVAPEPALAIGRRVSVVRRMGKRIVLGFEGGPWFAIHLMIAGRLHWRPVGERNKKAILFLDFDNGTLTLTEAGSKKRAALHVVASEQALGALDAGGIVPLEATEGEFAAALRRENHTLKRALTDPHLFGGIGNAYSDEILHRAMLSPAALTSRLEAAEVRRLYEATRETLVEWTARLRAEAAGKFPEKVTAFREGMAVHGRYGEACPRCGAKVQRIRYADNETNYCAACQTGGKLLADRALSRLLRQDWPRTLEELELRRKSLDRSGAATEDYI